MFAWQRSLGPVSLGFTDRHGGVSAGAMGSLNLGRTDVDDLDHVIENYRRFGEAIAVRRFITVHQVHGPEVLTVTDELIEGWHPLGHLGSAAGAPVLPVADAIVASSRHCPSGTALLVRVADCLPVVLADPERGVVGVAHAGRVGLLGGVLPATVAAMRAAGAERISAWVGPHVCGACYEVPEQMAEDAWGREPATRAETSWGTPSIDLGAGALAQLRHLDVAAVDIDRCTRTDTDLHSHRRDGAGAGRQVGAVWFTDA
ncbi:polyphenol oxidase family protein [Enemella sp. A6]|uniref:polyphenol oxidase family protein n=1 Tax=Enemella sp. A6 TaxID=3440152 RepID=UPI003EBD09A2